MNLDFEFSQIKSDLNKILRILEGKQTDRVLRMYDLADLQEIPHVSRRTIFSWKKQGKLQCTQIGAKYGSHKNSCNLFLKNTVDKYLINNIL